MYYTHERWNILYNFSSWRSLVSVIRQILLLVSMNNDGEAVMEDLLLAAGVVLPLFVYIAVG